MADEQVGEKTETATSRKREQAREKGTVVKSTEVNSLVVLGAGTAMLLLLHGWFTETIGRNTTYLLSQAYLLRVDNLGGLRAIAVGCFRSMGLTLAPLVAVLLVAGVLANVMQVGLKLSLDSLTFKPEKLNPLPGFKRFFQKRTGFELVKSIVKIALIAGLASHVIAGLMGNIVAAPLLPLAGVVELGRAGFLKLMATLLGFLVLLAVADWTFQHWQTEQELRMTKQEVKDEHKQFEGDAQIKARMRGTQMEMARKRMMAEVPRADVVVTNPTHFAVALKYESGAAAPRVVAKGADLLAQKIKAVARGARVPVIENKPLARALYREVEVGRSIPESLFQAVAEVLAYVYRLKKA